MRNVHLKGNTLLRRDDSNTSWTSMCKESRPGLHFELCPLYHLYTSWENGRRHVVMGLRGK